MVCGQLTGWCCCCVWRVWRGWVGRSRYENCVAGVLLWKIVVFSICLCALQAALICILSAALFLFFFIMHSQPVTFFVSVHLQGQIDKTKSRQKRWVGGEWEEGGGVGGEEERWYRGRGNSLKMSHQLCYSCLCCWQLDTYTVLICFLPLFWSV